MRYIIRLQRKSAAGCWGLCGRRSSFREALTANGNCSATWLDYSWSEEMTSALFSSMNELSLVWQSVTREGFRFYHHVMRKGHGIKYMCCMCVMWFLLILTLYFWHQKLYINTFNNCASDKYNNTVTQSFVQSYLFWTFCSTQVCWTAYFHSDGCVIMWQRDVTLENEELEMWVFCTCLYMHSLGTAAQYELLGLHCRNILFCFFFFFCISLHGAPT